MFSFYRFGPSLFYIFLWVVNIFNWSVKVRSETETCFSLIHIQYLNDLDPKQLYVYEYSSFLLIISFLTNTSIGGCLKKNFEFEYSFVIKRFLMWRKPYL